MWWPIVASTPNAEPTETLGALDEVAAFNMACHVVCIKGFVAPRWFWVPVHSTNNLEGARVTTALKANVAQQVLAIFRVPVGATIADEF